MHFLPAPTSEVPRRPTNALPIRSRSCGLEDRVHTLSLIEISRFIAIFESPIPLQRCNKLATFYHLWIDEQYHVVSNASKPTLGPGVALKPLRLIFSMFILLKSVSIVQAVTGPCAHSKLRFLAQVYPSVCSRKRYSLIDNTTTSLGYMTSVTHRPFGYFLTITCENVRILLA